jgi:hypothetical protein
VNAALHLTTKNISISNSKKNINKNQRADASEKRNSMIDTPTQYHRGSKNVSSVKPSKYENFVQSKLSKLNNKVKLDRTQDHRMMSPIIPRKPDIDLRSSTKNSNQKYNFETSAKIAEQRFRSLLKNGKDISNQTRDLSRISFDSR